MASIEELQARIDRNRKLLRQQRAAAKRRERAEYAEACRRLGEHLAAERGMTTAAAITEYLAGIDVPAQADPTPEQPQAEPEAYHHPHSW